MNRLDGERHQPDQSHVESRALNEAEASKQDYVLKIGLAGNLSKLNYYRRVMKNPKGFTADPMLRPYGAEMLATLLNILFTDTVVWNRTKTVLTRRKQSVRGLREDITDSGLRSLIDKAVESETPLEVILEVYSRGANIGGEREGFGRVNSFLAGGKARDLDIDLVDVVEPIVERKSAMLSTVKRVLKEKTK